MQDAVEALKKRHDFAAWSGRSRGAERVIVRNAAFSARVAPGWELVRQERREVAGSPACTESFWRPALAGADALVRVDVWECESASAAHELLIRLLADYQSPLVDRREDAELGDVMFAPPGAAAVLFARGNLVIGVTRAGRGDVSIVDLARRLDEDTMARPETAEGGDAETAVASGARSDGERRMRVDAPAPPTTTIKAFAPSGDLRVEHEQIVYRPDPGGEGVVTVYSIDADGRATRRVVRAPGTDVQ